jgi:hypothetical protein
MKMFYLKINVAYTVLLLCLLHSFVAVAQHPLDAGVKIIDDENSWQHVLKQYRGRTVVICFMESIKEKSVRENLEKIRETEIKLKGKNVVFLKCVAQSGRKDNTQRYQECVATFMALGMPGDVYYIENTLSVQSMAEDATEGHWGIYNAEGLIHHPTPHKFDLNKSFKDQVPSTTLLQELDTVLRGKGHYYERNADYFLRHTSLKKFASNDGNYKAWTLGYTSGPYLVYHAGDPDQPMYGREEDSLYQRMKFIEGKTYIEDSSILKKGPVNRKLFRYDYDMEQFWGAGNFSYVLDKKKNIITINDNHGKLYKRFRIVLISIDVMVVEAV